jgi:Ca2+/Na+ antiporter
MRDLLAILSAYSGPLLMIGAAIAFYVSARAGDDALSQGRRASPLRHALAYWVPMALVALLATLMGYSAVAVGVVFATSVAALSLNLGVIALSADEAELAPSPGTRAWPFLLPVAVLALVAGFSGRLTRTHAILLAVQGLMVAMIWRDRAPEAADAPDAPEDPRDGGMTFGRAVEFLLAAIVGLLGAWAAVLGAEHMSQQTRIMSHGLIAATTIGPLLVLPMIGGGSLLIRRGQAQAAMGVSVIIPLLNLCLLLPAVVMLWEVRPAVTEFVQHVYAPVAEASATTQPVIDPAEPLSYPIAVWRVDTVMLIVLALFILPIGLRRWTLARREGVALVVGYAVYLILTTTLGRRW